MKSFTAFVLATLIGALVLTWGNHLACPRQYGFVAWWIVAVGVVVAGQMEKRLLRLNGLIFVATILVQVLAWAGIIAVPLFR